MIEHSTQNGICTLTLNCPDKHNAFDEHLISELQQKLTTAEQNDQVRVVILRAAGKHFCAGADLNWMRRMAEFSLAENQADALLFAKLLQQLSQLKKPTIAVVQGYAIGGALGLIACCDIAISETNAKFCFSEVKLGLIPATIAPYIIRSIGYSAARQYFISAELFTANTAQTLGLIHHIVERDTLDQRSKALAEALCKNGPQAMLAAKQLVNQLVPIDAQCIADTANQLANIRQSDEGKEGVDAFLNKRSPQWLSTDTRKA